MPTGYTAKVQEGISFEAYALGCARNFGALILMRDDPQDAKIPEKFEPNDYHLKARVTAENTLNTLNSLSDEEAGKKALEQFIDKENSRIDSIKKSNVIEERYSEMLVKARAWESPSEDHDKFKEFMVSQLEQSIEFDCNCSFYKEPTVELTGAQWRSEEIKQANHNIAYHTKNYNDEVERTDKRNLWVDLLRKAI